MKSLIKPMYLRDIENNPNATGGYADTIVTMKAAGASVDVIELPKAGIQGNSHMMMMDKNNLEVAGLIQNWLEGKGLTKKP